MVTYCIRVQACVAMLTCESGLLAVDGGQVLPESRHGNGDRDNIFFFQNCFKSDKVLLQPERKKQSESSALRHFETDT